MVHVGVCSLIPAANANEKVIPHPIFQRDGKKADYYFQVCFCSCSVSADDCSWFGLAQRCEPQALLLNPTLAYQRSERFPWDTEGSIVSARGHKALW